MGNYVAFLGPRQKISVEDIQKVVKESLQRGVLPYLARLGEWLAGWLRKLIAYTSKLEKSGADTSAARAADLLCQSASRYDWSKIVSYIRSQSSIEASLTSLQRELMVILARESENARTRWRTPAELDRRVTEKFVQDYAKAHRVPADVIYEAVKSVDEIASDYQKAISPRL